MQKANLPDYATAFGLKPDSKSGLVDAVKSFGTVRADIPSWFGGNRTPLATERMRFRSQP